MAKKIKTVRKVESVIKPYELMIIVSSDLREQEVKKKLKEITDMIEKSGGKITHEDFWGKRSFAYKIGKHRDGYYVVYNTEMLNTFLPELKEHLRIEKEVVRSMILTLPADHVYTKYDLDAVVEEKKKPIRTKPSYAKRPEDQPVPEKKVVKKEEVKEEVKEEAKEDKEEKKKKDSDTDLDKKLDEILEGEDLKL